MRDSVEPTGMSLRYLLCDSESDSESESESDSEQNEALSFAPVVRIECHDSREHQPWDEMLEWVTASRWGTNDAGWHIVLVMEANASYD